MTVTLWIGAVLAALAYLGMVRRPPALMRTIIKAAAVALLAIIAAHEGGPVLLIVALVLSAIGDAFLAQEGERAFMAGLASFLLAHLAYVGLFVSAGSISAIPALPAALLAVWAVVLGTLLVRKAGALAVPVAFYVAAILAMGITALIPAGPALAGALAFMASDSLLGTEKFLLNDQSPARRMTSPAVWVLYVAGQALITAAFVGAPFIL